jgi:hypothetical protein
MVTLTSSVRVISQRMKEQKEIDEHLQEDNRELNKRILKLEKQLAACSKKPLSVCIGSSDGAIEELRIQIKHEVLFADELVQFVVHQKRVLL